MMTKYNHRNQRKSGIVDRLYNSFSLDAWLIFVNLILVANWFLNTESLFATLVMAGGAGIGGWAIVNKSRHNKQKFNDFLRRHNQSGLLLLILGIVTTVTAFNYMTDPSHALILTDSGITQLKKLFAGTGSGATTTTVGTAANLVEAALLVFRVLFFLGFLVALYKAYEKYTEQAELADVIKTPLVLLAVVGLVDTAAGIFLK
jgi:TRAP-type C4-dicarboxylate transport system permease small subunit